MIGALQLGSDRLRWILAQDLPYRDSCGAASCDLTVLLGAGRDLQQDIIFGIVIRIPASKTTKTSTGNNENLKSLTPIWDVTMRGR